MLLLKILADIAKKRCIKPSINCQTVNTIEAMLFAYKNFQRAVRKGDWKFIVYNFNNETYIQLFNLKVDPFETTNMTSIQNLKSNFK